MFDTKEGSSLNEIVGDNELAMNISESDREL